MDFPKVYFFGSLKKSLLPISQNPKIAAIFCCRRASRSEGPKARPPQGPKARSLTIIQYKSYCIILCSNSL